MKRKKETVIVKEILDYLNVRKLFCWRQNNIAAQGRVFYGKRGVADILGILPYGRFLAIEVKAKYGHQSEYQLQFQEDVERNGGLYILARSVEEVMINLPKKQA